MKNYLTNDTKKSEMNLLGIYPGNNRKVFILLEGESDIRLFRKLFNQKNVKISQVPGGNIKLENLLEELCLQFKNIIGIRDADFIHIDQKYPDNPVLFFTDEHDIEMMMIASDNTLFSIYCEFAGNEVVKINQFRKNIFKSVEFAGYFRYFNHLNQVGFTFGKLPLNIFINQENGLLNDIELIDFILRKSKKEKEFDDVQKLKNDIELLMRNNYQLTKLLNGHDCTSAIACFFNRHNKKGVSNKSIESHLRTAYSHEEFYKTKLYKDLKNWEKKTDYKLF